MSDKNNRLDQDTLIEKLIHLNRVAKVVKGGRRFSFSALVVVGNKAGTVGYGYGKANDLAEAIRKGGERARRNVITIPMQKATIPHYVTGKFKSVRVMLKPAAPGTGIIAGGPVRAVMELCGVHDVLSKLLGSRNHTNVVKAVFQGLGSLLNAKEETHRRGRKPEEMWD